jgi:glutamate racemase
MQKYQDYIGVIDSGVGGLDILNSLKDHFKKESFVFIGDNLNNPYGNKTNQQLEKIALKLGTFLQDEGVKMIIIACNTLSTIGLKVMRKKLKVPVYGIINPTAKYFASQNHVRPLVLATKSTVKNEGYLKSLHKYNQDIVAIQEPANDLVLMIESGDFTDIEKVLHQHIDPYLKKIDSLILGCTHFPIVEEYVKKLYPDLPVYNSREPMVELLSAELSSPHLQKRPEQKQDIVVYATKSKKSLYDASKGFFDYTNITIKEGLK